MAIIRDIPSSSDLGMSLISTGLGEAIPPHFQFSTKAKTAATERLRTVLITSIPNIRGKFGNTEEQIWSVTIGMIAKGCMDDEEFDTSICRTPLLHYTRMWNI